MFQVNAQLIRHSEGNEQSSEWTELPCGRQPAAPLTASMPVQRAQECHCGDPDGVCA